MQRSVQRSVMHGLCWGLGWFALFSPTALQLQAEDREPLSNLLAADDRWEPQLADFATKGDALELLVPINYKIGRAVAPAIPARAGQLFTLAGDVVTRFAGPPVQQTFYRCWLELEFLKDERVIATAMSPELIGSHAESQFLAVTAAAPTATTSVRVSLCAQNKFWSVVDNRATFTNVRLMQLKGQAGDTLQVAPGTPFPVKSGGRSASAVVDSNWPDGTAVALTSTRGTVSPAVLLSGGQAIAALHYTAEQVGAAEITARIADRNVVQRIADPLAATVKVDKILADGVETPALVQLVRNGEMIPGRYQASMPGIFVTTPWEIDLAPGRWQLRICRGPEFQVYDQTIDVKSGDTVLHKELELTRVADLREAGWFGGDADGDVYHGERIYNDVNAGTAAEIAQAMGLDWVGVGSWGQPDPKTWGEARTIMSQLSKPNFLFFWADEKPKSSEGHICLIGVQRPDNEPFGWGWTGADRPLRNFEWLQLIQASGAATFANHPLRWWTSGDRFKTNMYSSLPFDLCAAGLVDGYNVNEKVQDLQVWSMLLDRGYRIAATAGADFCLDRPSGPPPGKTRMYCYCPDGLSEAALAEAVRRGNTIVSSGPLLMAEINGLPPGTTLKSGQTYSMRVKAWARGDQPDSLERIELWAHGKPVASLSFDEPTGRAEETFEWTPSAEWDWVAVRAVSRCGWAITSAYYAAGPAWEPPQPVKCRLTLDVSGLSQKQLAEATVEVWDNRPALVTSRKLVTTALADTQTLDVPVSATVVIRPAHGKPQLISLYDALEMPEQIQRIASGKDKEQPLLDWQTYNEILSRCRSARVVVNF